MNKQKKIEFAQEHYKTAASILMMLGKFAEANPDEFLKFVEKTHKKYQDEDKKKEVKNID